ncbi:Putative Orn/DAP/Arg decarboxylase 2 [Magnetospirillum sp. XM-1]|uniref:type III PLP-dependent enzyme n=1 Tax=Magnetospirillum sp. XM-1 TaxID=1663591 RepID=UPI00073DF9C4|nr:type III PLP-dependent enzyme [Magnetospirillum sp. XM-1]CUW41266.1 Putative Orn/DAP/Arg decarboxylase 2 [Magnetospirillum sp. XM-1]
MTGHAPARGVTDSFPSVAAFVAAERPESPVHLLRPRRLEALARDFVAGFPGDTLYAVKCNAHPLVLWTMHRAGIRHFDVASPMEIARVVECVPDGTMFYHHPAKTPGQIRLAWECGVRFFAVDCVPELEKVAALTDATMRPVVRLAIPKGSGAVYDLSTKFGAVPDVFEATLRRAAQMGLKPAVTFHVGSQCLDPAAFRLGIEMACASLDRTGIAIDWMDVGGGFPAYYRLTQAPPLSAYFEVIAQAHHELTAPRGIRLACEPGRALMAEGGSLLVRINLRKPDAVYLNDGIFGGLTETYWGKDQLSLPFRLLDAQGRLKNGPAGSFAAFGPTCDGNDKLPWPLDLPQDAAEGDYIEFNLIGAYGREMAARYNGMHSDRVAVIDADFAGHQAEEIV